MNTNETSTSAAMTTYEWQGGRRDAFQGSSNHDLGVHILRKLINQNYLDYMNLLEACKLIGKENLTAILNQRIHNDRFTVELDFIESEEPVIRGEYVGFSIQLQQLIIPKSLLGFLSEEAIHKAFNLVGIRGMDEHTMSYTVSLNDEWDADTIKQIAKGINCYLGPFVEKAAKKLKLKDYRMVFIVGVTF
ncbi:hypothetical protein [Sporosarcina gallistercoris]|uniref:DUF2507 domain-containing protein n=1 Tax=Sporosarcina gallistercoris TaxID=2762245 RepID=A0ABR8PM23_9BACL|nr:hypothetical protein [Sporosarcina gallistercoris]MBD7909114.1 hypothetical protein [Sporosarcina gallistercoris]